MSQLTEFLSALGGDARMQKEFDEAADVVMSRYELTEEEKAALRARDSGKLRELSGPAPLSLGNSTVKSYA